MNNFLRTSAVCFLGFSIIGCQSDSSTDELMDPMAATENCLEGFDHSSDLQTLNVKNGTDKAIKIINMIGIGEGTPKLGTETDKFINVPAGGESTLYFFVDSFSNGGSILSQADQNGQRTITLDPICVETFQSPVYLRQSEGDDAWLVAAVDGQAPKVLLIGLDSDWSAGKVDRKTHSIVIDDKALQGKGGQEGMPEEFNLKP
jgi:hypothetical protein